MTIPHPESRILLHSADEAARMGCSALTMSYGEHETALLQKVLADLKRGGVTPVLVQATHGIEVWRAGMIGEYQRSLEANRTAGGRIENSKRAR